MSNKITEISSNKTDKLVLFKKYIILAVVILAICGSVCLFLFSEELNIDGIRRWGRYLTVKNDADFGHYSFDSHSSNCYERFDDGMAIASIGGLNIYDDSGNERYVIQNHFEFPALIVNDNMAVAYDVGGSTLVALEKNKGEVLSLEEDYPILDADLSEKGGICLSSSASGYKSVLSVYSGEQDLIYRWLSSSTYFPLCALAPNGREMAAVAVGQDEGSFESRVCLFKTDSEEIEDEISLGNQLIYDLVYLKQDTLCAVGESSVQYLSSEGKIIGEYEYTDNYLKDFDFGGDGFLTLATNMYKAGSRYSVTTVNNRGTEIASCYLGKEILDISASGRYIAVLMQGKLTIFTQSLAVYDETTDIADATSVVMRPDGSVLLFGGGEGRLYIP